jgi:hypothetical protein
VTLAISESFQVFSLPRLKFEVTGCHVPSKPRHTEQKRLRPLVVATALHGQDYTSSTTTN